MVLPSISLQAQRQRVPVGTIKIPAFCPASSATTFRCLQHNQRAEGLEMVDERDLLGNDHLNAPCLPDTDLRPRWKKPRIPESQSTNGVAFHCSADARDPHFHAAGRQNFTPHHNNFFPGPEDLRYGHCPTPAHPSHGPLHSDNPCRGQGDTQDRALHAVHLFEHVLRTGNASSDATESNALTMIAVQNTMWTPGRNGASSDTARTDLQLPWWGPSGR